MTGFARNECRVCGSRFFTWRGLREHAEEHTRPIPTRQYTPEGLASQQAHGRQVAERNNARRVRCDGCGHESTPGGIGLHQRYTGHAGRTELALVS